MDPIWFDSKKICICMIFSRNYEILISTNNNNCVLCFYGGLASIWRDLSHFLRTGNERHRTGRLTGAGLVGRDHLDGVHLSAVDPWQDTGAGWGVTSEALVTDHMVVYGSMNSLTKFPGHRETVASIGHHHGDVHRGRCWRSCWNSEMLIKLWKYLLGQSIEEVMAYAYSCRNL